MVELRQANSARMEERTGPSSVRAILIKRKRPRSSSNRVTACDQVSLVSQMATGQREGAASASPLRLSYRLVSRPLSGENSARRHSFSNTRDWEGTCACAFAWEGRRVNSR